LINGYSLQKLEGQSAYLRKEPTGETQLAGMTDNYTTALHRIDELVALPASNNPLLANIDIRPTFPGKVLSALYKLPELHITMRLRDGKIKNYRTISNMMKTDFLITPLVQSTEEFALLAAGGNKFLSGKEVESFTISSGDSGGIFWNKTYSLSLRELKVLKHADTENSPLFDKMSETVPRQASDSSMHTCEGMIETVNGITPRSGIPTVGNALSVQGWMAVSGKDGTVPDDVFVTLARESGRTIYIKTHSMRRDDVRRHFNQPGMRDSGYAAMVDVSSLSGRYALGLAQTYKGNFGICQQFKLPIEIAH
jgi:hypothetical protein